MSAGEARSVRSGPSAAAEPLFAAGAIALGLALVLLRPAIAGLPSSAVVLVAASAALAIGSLAVPLPASPAIEGPGLPPSLTVALGGAAVLAATAAIDVTVATRAPAPVGPAVIGLNTMAAIAEEAFFRRLVYGGLARWGALVAVLGSATLFALVHIPLYGTGVFWVDLGAGLVFSWQRWACGDWRAPAATHALANLLAVLR